MIGDYICIYIYIYVCVCVCGHIIIYECFVTSMLLTCIFLLLLLLDFPRKQLKHLTGILVYCICCLFWGRAMQTQCQAAFACILPSPRAPPGEKREGVGSGPWDNVQRACPAVHAPPPGGVDGWALLLSIMHGYAHSARVLGCRQMMLKLKL